MADKKEESKSGRRLTPDEQRAQDEATGDLPDGQVMLTNDSGQVKKVPGDEWSNEDRKAELLKQGWKEVGGE